MASEDDKEEQEEDAGELQYRQGLLLAMLEKARREFRADFWRRLGHGDKGSILDCDLVALHFINLERRVDRLTAFLHQLRRFPALLNRTKRVLAVDGQSLHAPCDIESTIVSPVGVRDAFEAQDRVLGGRLTRGACALLVTLHGVLQEISHDPEGGVHIICEDDVVLADAFPRKFAELLRCMEVHNADWDLLHIGYIPPPQAGRACLPCERDLRCSACRTAASGPPACAECPALGRPHELFGVYSLALRPSGAAALSRVLFPAAFQLDTCLNRLYAKEHIRAYAPTVPIVHAESSSEMNSDIQVLGRHTFALQYTRDFASAASAHDMAF